MLKRILMDESETVENQNDREDSLGEDHKEGLGPTWAVEPRSKLVSN
jgi:hypothetical protein